MIFFILSAFLLPSHSSTTTNREKKKLPDVYIWVEWKMQKSFLSQTLNTLNTWVCRYLAFIFAFKVQLLMFYFHLEAPLFSARWCFCVMPGTDVGKGKFVIIVCKSESVGQRETKSISEFKKKKSCCKIQMWDVMYLVRLGQVAWNILCYVCSWCLPLVFLDSSTFELIFLIM